MINTIVELNQNQISAVFGGIEDDKDSTVTSPVAEIDREKYVDLSPGGVAWRIFQGTSIAIFTFVVGSLFLKGLKKLKTLKTQ
ncbi:hypothetical protein GAMM_110035 [Gammaproteobacteria bacterium]